MDLNDQFNDENQEEQLSNQSSSFESNNDTPSSLQFGSRIDLQELQMGVAEIKRELGKIIIGQQEFIDLLIIAILSDGHVLIEGVPGIAKTLTAKLLARTINIDFSRIQFTPDLMPSDVLGTSIYNFQSSEFEFKQGPIFSNIVLIDEINRAPAKTQSALFEVMEERQVTFDGTRYKMSLPFIVLATQNPIEQEGTYRLPEAQLDRFLFKISVGYPTQAEEVTIIERFHRSKSKHDFDSINKILTAEKIDFFRSKVNDVHIDRNLIEYIAAIVHTTRNHRDLYLGASPRASLAIMTSSKAHAAISGRDFITPEDIKKVAIPVLRHRIILNPEKEMEGKNTDDIVQSILAEIEVPR